MYLPYIDGVTLDSRLEALNEDERKDVAQQLAIMLNSIRRLRQPQGEPLIGIHHNIVSSNVTSHSSVIRNARSWSHS